MNNITLLRIALAKNKFQLCGYDKVTAHPTDVDL